MQNTLIVCVDNEDLLAGRRGVADLRRGLVASDGKQIHEAAQACQLRRQIPRALLLLILFRSIIKQTFHLAYVHDVIQTGRVCAEGSLKAVSREQLPASFPTGRLTSSSSPRLIDSAMSRLPSAGFTCGCPTG